MADNVVRLWAFGVPEIKLLFFHPILRRRQKKALEYIRDQEGFVGVYPTEQDGHRFTLLIYQTENDAKIARNQLLGLGCPVSNELGEVAVSLADYESITMSKGGQRNGKI